MKKIKWLVAFLIVANLLLGVIGCKEPEIHIHTYSEAWTSDETNHWHAAICEHTDEKSGKAAHSFGEYVSNNDATTEEDGTKTRECSVCKYKDTVKDEGSKIHVHTYSAEWTYDAENHWHKATCEHTTEVSDKAEHTFGEWTTTKDPTEEEVGSKERVCSVCNYKETAEIEKLAHTHKFSSDWTYDGTHHWYAATCEHTTEVSEKAEHTFGDWTTTKEATEEAEGTKERSCTVCGYTATETIEKLAHTHKFSNDWTYDGTHHWKAAKCEHTSEVSEKAEHTFGEWEVTKEASCTEKGERKATCTICSYEKTEGINKAEHTYTNGICICGLPEGFVLIPAGTFQMGSTAGDSDEKPVHEVTITKDFYMGKYEVTQAEYEKYCSYTGSNSPSSSYGDGDNYPAYFVSWDDALVYCNKRSIAEGLTPCYSISGNTDPSKWGTVPISNNRTWNAVVCDWNANGYRLPTEAEWEYAARAGDNTVSSLTYAGTNSSSKLGEYAWYDDNSSSKTHEVGTKKANAFGLYDMSGNVWEWCWNWFASSYNTGTEGGSDPTGASLGDFRVFRGGSWFNGSGLCAVSSRSRSNPYHRSSNLGFRVVRASSN